jgi:Raf kinase inhibitor-like YbhB/YbcL family protein
MRLLSLSCALVLAAIWLSTAQASPTFVLGSKAFADGGTIPHEYSYDHYGCSGKNVSPELHWSGAPKGAKSLALTVFDPDAGKGKGWWHWVAYGMDPGTTSLAAGEPIPGLEGKTSFGSAGYGGPCPPPGDTPHHYVFTLYALDQTVGGSLDGPQLLAAIKGHVLGKAQLVGRFGR